MAGYLGTRAVLLSTTAANVTGDMTVAGDATVSGAFTSLGINDNATSTAITIDASENVGIGTTPNTWRSSETALQLPDGALYTGNNYIAVGQNYYIPTGGGSKYIESNFATDYYQAAGEHIWRGAASGTSGGTISWAERMRIDASGNVLVGLTATSWTVAGQVLKGTAGAAFSRDGAPAVNVNLNGGDGPLVSLNKAGTLIGQLSATGNTMFINGGANGSSGLGFLTGSVMVGPSRVSGASSALVDNQVDLGNGSYRFNDVWATNGTIQTSDRNEKQDIAVMDAAETRVAASCKGLIRKFRWKDAVTDKGDDARIHFGIIAQDLQDAFTAEGLDAGRYAMFISSTWWEIEVVVPAVEAVAEVLDEDGGVVTEAVDAVDAYTRTDTFDEVTEGATERTRLGVRYPELLAFIIGAL